MSELKVNKVTPSTGTQVELEATTLLVDGTLVVPTVNNPAGVAVQHNGSTKLATSSTGVTVTGTVTATAFSGSGAGLTGIIAAGTGGASSTGGLSVVAASGGGNVGDIVFYTNGTAGANIRGTCTNGGDWNFDSNTLFIQNSTNRVGIGTVAPASALDVTGTVRASDVTIVGTGQLVGGIGAVTTSGVLNWNDVSNARSGNGYTLLRSSTSSNQPTSYSATTDYFHPFSFEYSSKDGSGNMCQFAIPYTTTLSGIHYRTRVGGTWDSWRSLVTMPNETTPKITVTTTGVGIANTAPNDVLDVTGAIHATGAIKADAGVKFIAGGNLQADVNTLDDYEEGTFVPAYAMSGGTPAIGTITYNTGSTGGRYVKIGRLVHATGQITVTTGPSTAATGTYLVITGLPFAPSNNASVTIGYRTTTAAHWGGAFPATGYTFSGGIYLMTNAYAYLSSTSADAAADLTGTDLRFSVTYETNS